MMQRMRGDPISGGRILRTPAAYVGSRYMMWLTIIVLSICVTGIRSAAVMSIDLGSEWMKIGVVSPGFPMDIALNQESKRKTPTIIAFRDNVRSFGEDAMVVGIREPLSAYRYIVDLLGKTYDNDAVSLYRQRFPYYNIVADPRRDTIVFKKGDTEEYTVEELVSQLLARAKDYAQEHTKQPIKECVITVPGYFGQRERHALLVAAQLANLNVLQLINDYTAVALNYGVFHRSEINETAQYFVFYDMGAYKTSAAVVSYQLMRDKQSKEVHPVVQVLGVGYDRTLGGLEIQLRLRDYLAAKFNAMKRTRTDVTTNARALAKLFKEAGRLKDILSANNEYMAQIENLLEDIDFKVEVKRKDLEEMCADLWPRATIVLDRALTLSGLTADAINQVIVFGGGTRMPKVQEILRDHVKQDIGKSLNTDEAAVMGAVYKAADLAVGFKVKKFIIKDAVLFPIHLTFERAPSDSANVRLVKRVLFGRMATYPQRKIITFNKHEDDFDFHVHYGDMEYLEPHELAYTGRPNISHVALRGVRELLAKVRKDVVDAKGIKVYFNLDESGIFNCTGVEYVYEQRMTEPEDEGTLAKLGSTITRLFSKEATAPPAKEASAETVEAGDIDDHAKDEAVFNKTAADAAADGVAAAGNKTSSSSSSTTAADDGGVKGGSSSADASLAKNETVKIVTKRDGIAYQFTAQFAVPLDEDAFKRSLDKLEAIALTEVDRNRRASLLYALENHVMETQQRLDEEAYASCATADEKAKILSECGSISEWLEDVIDATADQYDERLARLQQLTDVVTQRHLEHEKRPTALKSLDDAVAGAQRFLETIMNLTNAQGDDKDMFTDVEMQMLTKIINETIEWRHAEDALQQQRQRHEPVHLTVQAIGEKTNQLDREVHYLINKIKLWKPKVVKPPTGSKGKKKTKEPITLTDTNTTAGDDAGVDDATLLGDEKDEQERDGKVEENEEDMVMMDGAGGADGGGGGGGGGGDTDKMKSQHSEL